MAGGGKMGGGKQMNFGLPRRVTCLMCGGSGTVECCVEGLPLGERQVVPDGMSPGFVSIECAHCGGVGYVLKCLGCGRYRRSDAARLCGCGADRPAPWSGPSIDQRCGTCRHIDLEVGKVADDGGWMCYARTDTGDMESMLFVRPGDEGHWGEGWWTEMTR